MLSPGEFIPAAEETGMIVPLGMEILGQAARQTAVWNQTLGLDPLRLSCLGQGYYFSRPLAAQDMYAFLTSAGRFAAPIPVLLDAGSR